TSTRLQGALRTLEGGARTLESATEGNTDAEVSGLQSESDATTGGTQSQWGALESQTTGRLTSLTTPPQNLVTQKTALIRKYQAPGTHNPELFQRRWQALQGQVETVEQEHASLDG